MQSSPRPRVSRSERISLTIRHRSRSVAHRGRDAEQHCALVAGALLLTDPRGPSAHGIVPPARVSARTGSEAAAFVSLGARSSSVAGECCAYATRCEQRASVASAGAIRGYGALLFCSHGLWPRELRMPSSSRSRWRTRSACSSIVVLCPAVGLLDGLASRGLLDRLPLELGRKRHLCLLERLERGEQLPALIDERSDRPAASCTMTQAQPQTLRRRQAAAGRPRGVAGSGRGHRRSALSVRIRPRNKAVVGA